MNILKGLFQKKESSCCDIKIEQVKEDVKVPKEDVEKNNSCSK